MIPRTTSSRWLAGAAVVVALLVVSSLVIAVLNRDREPDLLPAGSPGRAVQDYLLTVQDEGMRAANALLSEETRERCDWDNLSGRSSYAPLGYFPSDLFSIRLLREEEDDNEATVTVEVTEVDTPGDIPLFGGSVSEYETTYDLVREEGAWRLHYPGWCPEKATPTPPATTTAEEP